VGALGDYKRSKEAQGRRVAMNYKKEPWRLVVGILSVLFIIFLWVKNDIVEIYTSAPRETLVPMLVTTVAVSLLKLACITGILVFVNWLIRKIKNKRENEGK
jgi:Na+-driven multidrug efflux pump